jgi:uncharacterized protein
MYFTIGVTDLAKSVQFYRDGLGLEVVKEQGNLVYFQLDGIRLAIYPRDKLADAANVSSTGSGFRAVLFSLNVASRECVEESIETARIAGGIVTKPPQETSWGGYAGFLADQDGHLWEIVWNPKVLMKPE